MREWGFWDEQYAKVPDYNRKIVAMRAQAAAKST